MTNPVMSKVVQKLAEMATSADGSLQEELKRREAARLDAEAKLIKSIDSLTHEIATGQKESKKESTTIKSIGKYFGDKKNTLSSAVKSFTTKEGLLSAAMMKAGPGVAGALVGTLYENVKAKREAKEQKASYIQSMTHGTNEGRTMVEKDGLQAAQEHFSKRFDDKQEASLKVEKLIAALNDIDAKYKEMQAGAMGEKIQMSAEDSLTKESLQKMISELKGEEAPKDKIAGEPSSSKEKDSSGDLDELQRINSEQLDTLKKIEESLRVTPEEAHEAKPRGLAIIQPQGQATRPTATQPSFSLTDALDMVKGPPRINPIRTPSIDISDAIVKTPSPSTSGGRLGKLNTLAKFGKMIPGLGLALTAGTAAYGAFSGAADANEILGIEGREATMGEKVQAGASRALSGLSFGLVDEKSIAGGLSRLSNGMSDLLGDMSDKAKEPEKPAMNTQVVNNTNTNVNSSVVNTSRPSVRTTDPSMIHFSARNMVF